MWDSIIAWVLIAWAFIQKAWTSGVIWAKGNIAEWHSTTTFNIGGWLVDKFSAMLFVVGVVVFMVVSFFIIVSFLDPDKAEDNIRTRPPRE